MIVSLRNHMDWFRNLAMRFDGMGAAAVASFRIASGFGQHPYKSNYLTLPAPIT
jgi:hypothetical protein